MIAFPKAGLYRNEKLTRTAAGKDCTLLLPSTAQHGSDTVVWCHSNWAEHGKGSRLKAHDCFGAFGCAWCHAELDQGKRYSNNHKRDLFRLAMILTRRQLLNSGEVHSPVIKLNHERLVWDDAYWLSSWKSGFLEVKRAR